MPTWNALYGIVNITRLGEFRRWGQCRYEEVDLAGFQRGDARGGSRAINSAGTPQIFGYQRRHIGVIADGIACSVYRAHGRRTHQDADFYLATLDDFGNRLRSYIGGCKCSSQRKW